MHLEKEHLDKEPLEQSYINKILYIGTWHHIQPVRDFPLVKEFIFIDTQPRSKWDDKSYDSKFYKRDFYDDLIHKCICFGFQLMNEYILDPNYYKSILTIKQRVYYSFYSTLPHHINPTLLVFFNEKTRQTIKYYISTNIQYNMCATLQKDIEDADALIVSGYHPHIKLLEYFTKPKIFIGYSGTYYNIDENNGDASTIISVLHQSEKSEYFDKFLAVSKKTGKITKCTDIFDLKVKVYI